jgi:YidC/Oxa1 family membrane protein insertase
MRLFPIPFRHIGALMDQKRLFMAIAVSIAIMLGYQLLLAPHLPHPPAAPVVAKSEGATAPATSPAATGSAPSGAIAAANTPTDAASAAALRNAPRVKISAPRVHGSLSLLGARLDDLVLNDYRATTDPNSPQVSLLQPLGDAEAYYVQYGWSAGPGTTAKLPGPDTLWTASAPEMTDAKPVTLSWDNGAGLVFQIVISVDADYMLTVHQQVRNTTGSPVSLYPWALLRRDYTPVVQSNYLLHEGFLGVLGGTLHEMKYTAVKSDGEKHDGVGFDSTGDGGWAGITDKYWLAALVPNQAMGATSTFRHLTVDGHDAWQVDVVSHDPVAVPANGLSEDSSRVFLGAKVVRLLDHYEAVDHIPNFDKAVDFGWFYFLTKPIFYALDWLNAVLGNFGLAIMVFTICVKALFFPLANKSYRSMSKMKLLGPKMTALKERYKDDPAKLQSEMMQMYKAEKVNPASGCLPMLIQIPVFFCLYKDIYVTIEMRQAPFFGWIHDLSVPDPTNIFTAFGLIPWDPTAISPLLHLGIWPLIMGATMFFQQKLNPPPPDPMQARLFQFMPLIFMFMLGRFPAGLVIYWSWNNTLTIAQQWLIMRRTRLAKPRMART